MRVLVMATLVLKGLAASPGTYVGRTFVSKELAEIPPESMEVLVVKTASVEWLEAILRFKAVVTEVGGRTSHAATICRELGKPCVTAVPDVMSKLKSGTLVSVNGSAGEVTILS